MLDYILSRALQEDIGYSSAARRIQRRAVGSTQPSFSLSLSRFLKIKFHADAHCFFPHDLFFVFGIWQSKNFCA